MALHLYIPFKHPHGCLAIISTLFARYQKFSKTHQTRLARPPVTLAWAALCIFLASSWIFMTD